MKIGYLINSHGDYAEPLRRLLRTLVSAGIPDEDVLVVSGGHREPVPLRIVEAPGFSYKAYRVDHDSWDYTGLIELVTPPTFGTVWEFERNHTHFFCLQDTMEFGLRTSALVSDADPDKWATAAFGGQCNLVLYKREYLWAMRQFILGQRNRTKLESIEYEGALFKMLAQNLSRRHEASFANATHAVLDKDRPYSDVERIKEYYAGVDIIKWKANWGHNMHDMAVKP